MKLENPLKKSLSEGRMVCGCTVTTGCPAMVEIFGIHGLDFVFIDSEHTPVASDTELYNLIRAAEATGIVPMVRVKENQEHFVRNALEAGALALVFPHVQNRDDAHRAVRFSKFPPEGVRGANPFVRAGKWGYDIVEGQSVVADEFIRSSNEAVMVILLVEDREGVENLDEILEVEGVDALSFGPFDYSLSMGLRGDDPRIWDDYRIVVDKAKRKGLSVLTDIFPATEEKVREYINMGVNFLLFGLDVVIMNAAVRSIMQNVVNKIR
jgi:4-hydroxy-2-oxoheptanedioate aldolase